MRSLSLDFKEIAFIDRNEGFISDFHVHSWFDISFVMKGSVTYEIGGNIHSVSEGEVVVVSPGQPHKEICDSRTHFEVLFVCINFLRDGCAFNIAEHLGIPEVTRISNLREIFEIFEDILNEVTYRSEGYLLKINAQILNLLVAICRNRTGTAGKIDSIRQISNLRKKKISEEIKEYMGSCYNRRISLDDLSKKFYLSPQYISSLFKQHTGYTPIEFLNRVRITKAKELFQSGRDNIGEVAESVGIGDIHYFYKVFRQFEKKTPAQYIAGANREAEENNTIPR